MELPTLKFNKSECGVDFLLNVLSCKDIKQSYFTSDFSNTDFFEVFFFKKGKGYLFLNHEKIEIKDNSIVFISPLQKRKWQLDINYIQFDLLIFQEDFLNDFFSDKLFTYRLLYFYQLEFPLIMDVSHQKLEKYHSLLIEMKSELNKTKIDSVHIIRSLIYYLLQKLNREYASANNLILSEKQSNYAFTFKKLIEIHIEDKQRVNDYLQLLKISRISLNKSVKKQFNITPTELLKKRLLIQIKDYLIYTDLSVQEISQKLNFSESNHLMRFFKKLTGITISEFVFRYQNGLIK